MTKYSAVPNRPYRRRLILAKPDVSVAAKVMALIKRALFLQHAWKERIIDVVYSPNNSPLRHDFTTEPLINRIARVTRVPTEPELRTRLTDGRDQDLKRLRVFCRMRKRGWSNDWTIRDMDGRLPVRSGALSRER